MPTIPNVHPKWGKVPPFHPKWGLQGYKNWLWMKEEEARREENKRRKARGLSPKPRKKTSLPIDKWVMRVNREIQNRRRHRRSREPMQSAEKFKQLRLDERTGEMKWVMVTVSYRPAAEIFGDKLGPQGRAEDVRVTDERVLRSRGKINPKAINRRYKCIYRDEVLDKSLLGGWSRRPLRKAPWAS